MKPVILPVTYTADDDKNETSIGINGFLHVFLRRFWVILLGAVAGGLIGKVYADRITKRYVSKTVIQIESQAVARPIASDDGGTDNLRDPLVMETVIQNFRNR